MRNIATWLCIFFGFGTGIHAYTEGGSIQGFDISDNVWFHTGAATLRVGHVRSSKEGGPSLGPPVGHPVEPLHDGARWDSMPFDHVLDRG